MPMNNFKQSLREHVIADADVGAIIGTRIFPMTIPKSIIDDSAGLPVLTFSVKETEYTQAFEGNILAAAVISITAFDDDLDTIEDLQDKLVVALDLARQTIGSTNPFLVQNARAVDRFDVYLPDPGLFGDQVDFRFEICE